MRLKLISTLIIIAGLLPGIASAREWTKEETAAGIQKWEFTRYAPAGENRALEFLVAARPNCGPFNEKIVVKLIRKPEHGTAEFTPEETYPNFAEGKYAKCNDNKMPGITVNYKSSDDYAGPDSFTILAVYPTGLAREILYKMIIR
jgi:hypothetical protein